MRPRDATLRSDEVAIVGDLHGCGEEFGDLLAILDRQGLGRRIVLVGDLLTKGPRPDLVVRAILARRDAGGRVDLVCGNHDLRMLAALHGVARGLDAEELPRTERACLEALRRRRILRAATGLLAEACDAITVGGVTDAGNRWTALHAGIEPELGLAGTPDPVKIHLKAAGDGPHWWERYRGEDGLLVVGHKPLRRPLAVRRAGRPVAVNVDTGCAYGNLLTAYLPGSDRFVSVPSRQPRGGEFRRLAELAADGSSLALATR